MRATDEGKSPEAIARERDERGSKVAGFGLMAFGALLLAVPIVATNDIGVVPALAGIAIMVCGGLVRDPKTFRAVAKWGIDALPGGKS
jgi:hypothetical protein